MAHIGSPGHNFRTDKLIWTDELYRIYGLEPQSKAIYFQDFLELIHPEDSLMVQQTINKCALNHRPYSITFRIILQDGTERIVSATGEIQRQRVAIGKAITTAPYQNRIFRNLRKTNSNKPEKIYMNCNWNGMRL